MNKKKGISPLIATVLIIGFTIALAAVVFTWGGGFVRSTTERTGAQADLALKCSTELVFDIKTVDTATNQITIDNKGDVDIKSLMFRFYDEDTGMLIAGGTVDTALNSPSGVLAYALETFAVTIPETAGKVEAIAKIDDGTGETATCAQAGREKSIE